MGELCMMICTSSVGLLHWKAMAISSLWFLCFIPSGLAQLHLFATFGSLHEVNYKINCIANKLSLTVIAISKNICFHCSPSAWHTSNYRYPDQYLFPMLCVLYDISIITKASLFSMKSENGTSSKTVWRTGHFAEVLKDELVVSGGGDGGVMQMPVPINALEKWHQHQQWKRLIDEQGRATLYIKERTFLARKADQQVWLLCRTDTLSTKPAILFPGHKDRKSGKNGMTVQQYYISDWFKKQKKTKFYFGR